MKRTISVTISLMALYAILSTMPLAYDVSYTADACRMTVCDVPAGTPGMQSSANDGRVWGVDGGAAEWSLSGGDPTAFSCGGCNEMRALENSDDCHSPYPMSRYRCPLNRTANMGFRLVAPLPE